MRILIITLVWFGYIQPVWSMDCSDLLTSNEESPSWIKNLDVAWDQQKVLFNKKQVRVWDEALEHLKEDLLSVNEKASEKDKLLKEEYVSAIQKLDLIFSSYEELKRKKPKDKYFGEIFQAVWSTLTVHSHELLEMRSREKDYPRYFKILKTISEFDPNLPEFSLYKIKRSIEGRFSMKEYIHCKL